MRTLLVACCALIAVPAVAQYGSPAMPPPPAVPGVTPAVPQGGMPMMQMMSRAQVAANVQRMFAMVDANRDGVIDQTEAAAARMRMQSMRRPGMAGEPGMMRGPEGPGMMPGQARPDRFGMFDQLDTNHDGVISRGEFAARPMPRGGGQRGMAMQGGGMLFGMADANHDGRVTLQEATALALHHFDMMDSNRDGQVSPDERAAGRARMRTMHPG